MTEWRDDARALKAANPERSYASIARELGVTRADAWKALNPERHRTNEHRSNQRRRPAKRAWENEHDRGTCACGATLAAGARRKGIQRCIACECAGRRAQRLARAAVIERMWAEGRSLIEIAAALDTTHKSISVEIARLRREGLADLPYRYAIKNSGRAAA